MNILRFRGLVVLSAVIALAGCLPVDPHDYTRTVELETCHLVRPYNVAAPVFGWKMKSPRKGARQTAYRLTVQSPCGQIVWESGEVASDVSVGVEYAGPALKSGLKYTWTVQVKDERGVWHAPVSDIFETGLLDKDDWAKARFISVDGKQDGASGRMNFLKTTVNAKDVCQASWFTTGFGDCEVYVNGTKIMYLVDEFGEPPMFQKPGFSDRMRRCQVFGFDITRLINRRAGEKNVYAARVGDGWRGCWLGYCGRSMRDGMLRAFVGVMIYRYADGTEERFYTDASWAGACENPVVTHAGVYGGLDKRVCTDSDWKTSGNDTGFGSVVFNEKFKDKIMPLLVRDQVFKGAMASFRADGTLQLFYIGENWQDDGKNR